MAESRTTRVIPQEQVGVSVRLDEQFRQDLNFLLAEPGTTVADVIKACVSARATARRDAYYARKGW